MRLTAFDVETWGTDPAYPLQPFRVRTGDAWITCCAIVTRGPNGRLIATTHEEPTVPQLRKWLLECAATRTRIVCWNTPFDMAWLIALGLRAEVFACQWLDASLMLKHLCIRPTFEGKPRSYGLKAAVAERWPQHATYGEDVHFGATRGTPERTKLIHYNMQDSAFTLKLAEHYLTCMSQAMKRAVLVEAACLPLIAESIVEGVAVDEAAALALDAELQKTIDTTFVTLTLQSPIPVTDEILASPKQLGTFLTEGLRIPAAKYTDKGAISTDREALQYMAVNHPMAALINDNREATNNRTKFVSAPIESLRYNGDGRTRPQFRVFGTYCVSGDTEVLTRDGWKRIDLWGGGDIVCYNSDGTTMFDQADIFYGPLVDDWVHVATEQLDCMYTLGHTVPYLQQRSNALTTMKAEDLLTRKGSYSIPHGGRLVDDVRSITSDQLRLLVAIQADGYFTSRGAIKFTFKKQRKIDRIEKILYNLNLPFRKYVCAKYPDRTEITINKKCVPLWATPDRKLFGAWLLQGGAEGITAIVDELPHWDGSYPNDGGWRYSSAIESNVSWAVTICSLAGHKCRQHKAYRGMHSMHVSEARDVSQLDCSKHVAAISQKQLCYCPVTSTGYWLARRNGKIFVTGNTGRGSYSSTQGKGKQKVQTGIAIHQWKRDPAFRKLLIPPQGYTLLEFDFAGQEYRWMAVVSGDNTMLAMCAPGEDAHAYMGAQVDGSDYATLAHAVKSGDKTAKAVRQLGKVANLSCQYMTSAATLQRVAAVQHKIKITEDQAKLIHGRYRTTYPGVPTYWRKQKWWVKRNDYVENLAGRRIYFKPMHERTLEWSYNATAVNYPVQSMGAEQKYLALMVLRNELPKYEGRFYYELHDGMFVIVKNEYAERAAHELRDLLSNLPYKRAYGLSLPIQFPVDAKMGASWGDLVELK